MIQQFFRAGLRDAEQRLGRITAGVTNDAPEVMQVVGSSRTLGAVERVFAIISRAAESSAAVAAGRSLEARWRELAVPSRWRAVGVVLLTASAVHVGLTMGRGAPPGWLWLILPGMAAAVGGLLTASGFAGAGKAAR